MDNKTIQENRERYEKLKMLVQMISMMGDGSLTSSVTEEMTDWEEGTGHHGVFTVDFASPYAALLGSDVKDVIAAAIQTCDDFIVVNIKKTVVRMSFAIRNIR